MVARRNTVAAYDPSARKLVIVTTNYNNGGQWISFDLSAFGNVSGAGGAVLRWATNTDAITSGTGDLYSYYADTLLYGKRFWSWFAPNTVQTFEINKVW